MAKKETTSLNLDARQKKLCQTILGAAGGRYYSYDAFRWMLDATLGRFGLPMRENIPSEAKPLIEDVMQTYRTLASDSEPFKDILGPIYMELATHGGKSVLGQYFSPQPIARMMAEMLLGDDPSQSKQLVTACDPACGSGVMMLSWCQAALNRYGSEALRRCSVTGVDIDAYCARMCAVQFLMNCHVHGLGIGEILVVRGNSLAPFGSDYQVIVHATAKGLHPDEIANPAHPRRLRAIQAAAKNVGVGQQQDMFGNDQDFKEAV